ncbi:MAG: hypothetical protein WA154_12915 [Moraxellaceae bacterium]
MARPPQSGVGVIASPSGVRYEVPRSNIGLELAQSLEKVNGNLTPALNAFATQKQASLAAQAKQDAGALSGEAFKEAVKSGRLQKTQNPWYVKAYEETAAGVRGQAAMSQLVADAQSWAERDDPQAFATKWAAETGKLGEQFKGTDQLTGFQGVAAPLSAQVLAQNVAYNAQRMQAKNVSDVTTATSTAIQDLRRTNPKASAADVFAATEAGHQQWLAVGNTEEQWQEVLMGSVAAAAYALQDSSILDVLKDDRGGKGALYNASDKNGNPNAEQIEQWRYRVDQAVANAGMAETKQRANQIASEGSQAYQYMWDTNGTDFIDGKLSKQEIVEQMKAQGFKPQAIQWSLKKLSEDASANQSLSNALMGGDPEVLTLYTEANRNGFSEDLVGRTNEKVRRGELTVNEAQQIISAATSRSNHFESEARSDARSSRSDNRAAASQQRQLTTREAKDLKDSRGRTEGQIATALARVGKPLKSKDRVALTLGMRDAEGYHLAQKPGDFAGAANAVDIYAATYLKSRMGTGQRAAPGASSTRAANPRGN